MSNDKLSQIFWPGEYNRMSLGNIFRPWLERLNRLLDGYLFNTVNGRTVISDYTATKSDSFIPVDATSGNVAITLPDSDETDGKLYVVKKIDASANLVTVTATQTIDDASTKTLTTQYQVIRVLSNETEYWTA